MSEPNAPADLGGAPKCPKCGYTRDLSWEECPACGVVFSRFRSADEQYPEEGYAVPSAPPAAGWAPPDANPYATPQAEVYQPYSMSPGSLELASPWIRLGAQIVNVLIFMLMFLVAAIPLIVTASKDVEPGCGVMLPMVLVLCGWIAWNCVWLARYGQSVGKRLCKIKVVRSNGEPASAGRLIGLRYTVGTFILGQIPLYGIVDAFFIFREDQRCIHDHIADTIVVKIGP